jgi:hypothetical protein
MTIKIEKISESVYKFIDDGLTPAVPVYYDLKRRLYSDNSSFSYGSTALMSNDDWEMLKIWCKEQDLPFPHTEPDTDTLPNPNRERYSPEVGTWVWVKETEPETEPEPSILSACEKYWAILEGTEPTSEVDTMSNPERYYPAAEPNIVVKRGVQADSVNVTLANADKGMYRIEWRNSESGKTRFIVHCYGCANSLQVARGIAFAQCAKITHPMSKPTNDLSDHP